MTQRACLFAGYQLPVMVRTLCLLLNARAIAIVISRYFIEHVQKLRNPFEQTPATGHWQLATVRTADPALAAIKTKSLRYTSILQNLTALMHRLWLIAILSITLTNASAQSILSGMAADSTTLQSLPNVNIQVKSKTYGTITDARGFFRIQIAESDTLIFSMIGYRSRVLTVSKVRDLPVIYLKQEAQLLKTIEINADILIPGLDKMQVMKAWENPANTYGKTPGFQGIETFGPGHTFRGGELQHNVEEKKVKEVRAIRDKGSRYVEMVNSTDVKDKLMAEFHVTEEKYFTLIAGFNQRNQSIIYELSKAELISLLTLYFSENVNRK